MISYVKTMRNPHVPTCHIDSMYLSHEKNGDLLTVRGWTLNKKGFNVIFKNKNGNVLSSTIERSPRNEVLTSFVKKEEKDSWNLECGFLCKVPCGSEEKIQMEIQADELIAKQLIDTKWLGKFDVTKPTHRMVRYLLKYGIIESAKRAGEKTKEKIIKKSNQGKSYEQWIKENEPDSVELERQKRESFHQKIVFSIVVPLYNTPIPFLESMIQSITAQTYDNWQLCLADGSSNDEISIYFKNHYQNESRILYQKLKDNGGIAENTNAALDMAIGDFVVLGDHDDTFAPNALYELMKVIDADDMVDVVYSDEDKIDYKGKRRFDPYFKSDFNIDLLCSNNYICHLFCVRKQLIDSVGGFKAEYDGAQDHDFILRCVEHARSVKHIPKILYHWRCHNKSTSVVPESKMYAFENGKKAVADYFQRIGVEVEMEDGKIYGQYHAKHIVQGKPLVSILIPNKDHIDDLEKCLASIDKNTYDNYEVIIIENNSSDKETFVYYDEIDKHHKNCKVVYWEHEFNYSKINNLGAKYAKGEYLLFLNNDIEAINNDWLERMLGYCQREDVGIVGAKLLYPDGVIQHAGVIFGFGGIAGHAFIGLREEEINAFGRENLTQDYTAVTAACMMTKKEIFEQVEGFDETLQVAFNDIDFCMKVRTNGKLVVYNSMACLYHYESKSRGQEDTPEKQQRFAREVARFQDKWGRELELGDPYYNKNLSLERADYSIK